MVVKYDISFHRKNIVYIKEQKNIRVTKYGDPAFEKIYREEGSIMNPDFWLNFGRIG